MRLRLPYFHRAAVGLYISSTSVRCVELVRSPRGLSQARYDVEPVTGDVASALRRLRDRMKTRHCVVAANIDSSMQRQFVIRAARSEASARQAWIMGQLRKRLPSGINLDDFVIRYYESPAGDEQVHVFLGVARRSAVEAREQQIREAGFNPVSIASMASTVGHAFAFDPGFAGADVDVLLPDAAHPLLVRHVKGIVTELVDVEPGAEGGATLLDEAVRRLASYQRADVPRERPVLIVAADVDEMSREIAEGIDVKAGRPLRPLVSEKNALPPAASEPAGLAMSALYPQLPSLNYMDREGEERSLGEANKHNAIGACLFQMGSVLIALLALSLFNAYLNHRLQQGHELLLQAAPQRAKAEQARLELTALRKEQERRASLMSSRTNVAGVLELVGATLPESSWLQELHLTTQTDAPSLLIRGYTLDDVGSSAFIDRLEHDPAFADVRLVVAEVGPPADPKLSTADPLQRFEIVADIVTASEPREEP